jgi:3-dehydroquinate synthase
MPNIKVNLAKRSYNIIIGEKILGSSFPHIKKIIKTPKVFIISDRNVAKHHLTVLTKELDKNNITHFSLILRHGEAQKSFSNIEKICTKILSQSPDRNITLIALGGGVVGDITGFVASILLRGVNFIQIPTTLLAQVDSSVGGKTGINSKYGKNLIGAFHQPSLVLADITLLKTLPEREYLSGYAEIIKYALIGDIKFFHFLDSNKAKIKKRDSKIIAEMVKISCETKAKIVSQDEKEQGNRALLNLGHTFGHALEKDMNYSNKLKHGEAVSIGMVMAFQLSEKLGFVNKKDTQTVIKHLKDIGLPTRPLDIKKCWNAEKLLKNMYGDKKSDNGKLNLILPKKLGKSEIVKNVDPTIVLELLKSIN